MTQPKRPISRSSTPIEFAPLILDLEPEIKEEPKQKRGRGTKPLVSIVGIAIVIGIVMVYWGFRGNNTTDKSRKEMRAKSAIDLTIPDNGVLIDEKQQIFTYGAKNAKLQLEHAEGQDIIKVLIQDKAPNNITWIYEWTRNNDPIGKGEIVKGSFKRGDNVAVKILPFDGENYGTAKLLTTEIKNTVPRVTEGQSATFNDKNLTYQIKATDPDGDTLTYSLVEAPPGVNIDQKSGVITWLNVPEDQQKLDLKVKINDGHNGEIIYQSTVNFSQPVKEKLTAQK